MVITPTALKPAGLTGTTTTVSASLLGGIQVQGGVVVSVSTTTSLSGVSVSLNANGVTTSLTNSLDPGSVYGFKVADNTTGYTASHAPTGFRVYNGSGTLSISLDASSSPRLYLRDGSGNILTLTPAAINVNGSNGFNGTGAYTNFTIKNGIITSAS
jgi:hypothetical protein